MMPPAAAGVPSTTGCSAGQKVGRQQDQKDTAGAPGREGPGASAVLVVQAIGRGYTAAFTVPA